MFAKMAKWTNCRTMELVGVAGKVKKANSKPTKRRMRMGMGSKGDNDVGDGDHNKKAQLDMYHAKN